jgi:hypothetical protein
VVGVLLGIVKRTIALETPGFGRLILQAIFVELNRITTATYIAKLPQTSAPGRSRQTILCGVNMKTATPF